MTFSPMQETRAHSRSSYRGGEVIMPGAGPVGYDGGPLLAAGVAHQVPSVGRGKTLREVSEQLAREPSGALLVDDPGEPIQVVSLRDVTAAVAAGADPD